MACFIVPAVEAAVVEVTKKVVEKKEENVNLENSKDNQAKKHKASGQKIAFSTKLGWLNKLLAGGATLLAFEHFWHGELVPYFPFLTAMKSAKDAAAMFHEMGTVGVTMAAIITAVWGAMVLVSNAMEKRAATEEEVKEEA